MRFRFAVLKYALAGGVLAAGWAAAGLDVASPFAKQADAADNAKKASNNGKSNGKDNDKNGGKGGGKNAKSNKSGAKSGASASLPPLKTADDKLEFLEKIHRSFPARKVDTAFKVEELDRNLRHFMALPPEKYAPPASDETLVRRIYLDLTGRLPDGDTVKAYVADQSVAKRAKLVDKLLDSPEFGKYWGRYWRNVIFQKATTMNKRRVDPQALEDWLAKEFNKNEGWDRIVCEMISATPKRDAKKDGNEWGQKYGPNNFVLAFENDAGEIASQTARIFMGISIQCAECHNHPFDKWKREQFHEMAAFFSSGKYYMPDQQEPTKKTEIKARFLLGEKPAPDLKPDALRVAVAAYLVYNPDNYWFARAFVNRIWGELVGDGFYSVDSLGPDKDCVYPIVVNRLAAVFRYKDFDVKWVFRTIMSSEAYLRSSRSISDPKELFSAVRPSRLRPDQVLNSLEHVVGSVPARTRRGVADAFAADLSASQDSLEGSLQQALLMMNNDALQQALQKSRVRSYAVQAGSNDEAIRNTYLGVLAREPSSSEYERWRKMFKQTANRQDSVDDLLWVLVNSTEFVTKR